MESIFGKYVAILGEKENAIDQVYINANHIILTEFVAVEDARAL